MYLTAIIYFALFAILAYGDGKSVGQARWWTVPVGVGEDPLIVGMPHSEKDQKAFLEALHAANAAGKCGICKLLKIREGGGSNAVNMHPAQSSEPSGPVMDSPASSLVASHHQPSNPSKSYHASSPSSAGMGAADSLGSSASAPAETHQRPAASSPAINPSAAVEQAAPETQHNSYKRHALFSIDHLMRVKRKSNTPKSAVYNEKDLAGGMMQHDTHGRHNK